MKINATYDTLLNEKLLTRTFYCNYNSNTLLHISKKFKIRMFPILNPASFRDLTICTFLAQSIAIKKKNA